MQDDNYLPELHGFRKVSQCHWNDSYQCPYNPEHVVQYSRCQYHIVKCAQKYEHLGMVTCPFNATHITSKQEHRYHMQHCPDRSMTDSSNCNAEAENLKILKNEQHGNTSVPAYEQSEEDYHWDHVSESDSKRNMGAAGLNLGGSMNAGKSVMNSCSAAEGCCNDCTDSEEDDVNDDISISSYRKPKCEPLIVKMNELELKEKVIQSLPAAYTDDKLTYGNDAALSIRKPHTESILLSTVLGRQSRQSLSTDSSDPSFTTCPDLESLPDEESHSMSLDSGKGSSLTSEKEASSEKGISTDPAITSQPITSLLRGVKIDRAPGIGVTSGINHMAMFGLGRGGGMRCVGLGRGYVLS